MKYHKGTAQTSYPPCVDRLSYRNVFFDHKSIYCSSGFISMVLLQNERMQNLNLQDKAGLRRH